MITLTFAEMRSRAAVLRAERWALTATPASDASKRRIHEIQKELDTFCPKETGPLAGPGTDIVVVYAATKAYAFRFLPAPLFLWCLGCFPVTPGPQLTRAEVENGDPQLYAEEVLMQSVLEDEPTREVATRRIEELDAVWQLAARRLFCWTDVDIETRCFELDRMPDKFAWSPAAQGLWNAFLFDRSASGAISINPAIPSGRAPKGREVSL